MILLSFHTGKCWIRTGNTIATYRSECGTTFAGLADLPVIREALTGINCVARDALTAAQFVGQFSDQSKAFFGAAHGHQKQQRPAM